MNAMSIIEKTALAHAKARKSYPFDNGEYQFLLKHGGLPEAFDERVDDNAHGKRTFAYMAATGGALAAVGGLVGGPVGAAVGAGFGTSLGMALDMLKDRSLVHKARAMRDEAVRRGDLIAGMPAKDVTFDDTVAWHVLNPGAAKRLADIQSARAAGPDAGAGSSMAIGLPSPTGRQTRAELLASLNEKSRNLDPDSRSDRDIPELSSGKSQSALGL